MAEIEFKKHGSKKVAPERNALETHPNRVGQREIGGRSGPEPTRYGDWEKSGRCVDF